MSRYLAASIVLATASLLLTQPVSAQQVAWPTKPVTFVVPFAVGGSTDALARTIAKKVSAQWGQPVLIDNRPGAGTTVGTAFVARAPADGHTVLFANAPFVITQYAYANLNYDGRRDFAPVTLLTSSPLLVTVNTAKSLYPNLNALVEAAKKSPGTVSYGTPGNGSLPHLAVELFRQKFGIDLIHVPYRGGGPAVIDLAGGQLQFMFASPIEVSEQIKSGRLAPIGVTSRRRLDAFPNVPTAIEQGFTDYEAYAWFGVVVPMRTPQAIVDRLSADIVAALNSPDIAAPLRAQGSDLHGTSPKEFGEFLEKEHGRWAKAVKEANLKVD
jgi:tripartite-type tricarboxylate transporter receptor subunit TctC